MSTSSAEPPLRIFIASQFIDEVRQDFKRRFDVHIATQADPLEELRGLSESGPPFDALVLSLTTPMRDEQLAALPSSLRAIATYSVGTDHIDLEAAQRRGLAVFNTPGVLADSVAENAIFLMLGAARRANESIDLVRSRAWKGWTPTQIVGVELAGRRLGILGLGDIGRRIALRARALGMEISYSKRSPLPPGDEVDGRYCASAQELAAESDVLLLACPSTEETRGIVNAELLAAAQPGMILVNIARGDLVDDDALIDALQSGRVWAAGLDVFHGEPQIDERYFDLPKVFMLPHIGSSTLEARIRMGRILCDALDAWRCGERPSNQVV